jgi:hypothetical protein
MMLPTGLILEGQLETDRNTDSARWSAVTGLLLLSLGLAEHRRTLIGPPFQIEVRGSDLLRE